MHAHVRSSAGVWWSPHFHSHTKLTPCALGSSYNNKKKRHKHAKHVRPIVNYKNHSARYLRHRANGATHDRRVYTRINLLFN